MGRCLFPDHRRQHSRQHLLTDEPCPYCAARICEGVIELSIDRFRRCHRRHVARFWSKVSLPYSDDWHVLLLSCWHHDSGTSLIPAFGRNWTPQQLSYALCWGDRGPWPLEALCDDSSCCNPYHLRVNELHQPSLELVLSWPAGVQAASAEMQLLSCQVQDALGTITLPAPDRATP
jgi:hypothetical protein